MRKSWLGFVAVALAAMGLAVALALLVAPDTGPELAVNAARPSAPPARTLRAPSTCCSGLQPSPAPTALRRPATPDVPAPEPVDAQPLAGAEAPPDVPDRDNVQNPDAVGISQATLARRDEVQRCWSDFRAQNPGLSLRPTLKVVLIPGDPGTSLPGSVAFGTSDPAMPDGAECLGPVFADARFGEVLQPKTVFLPIPMGQ